MGMDGVRPAPGRSVEAEPDYSRVSDFPTLSHTGCGGYGDHANNDLRSDKKTLLSVPSGDAAQKGHICHEESTLKYGTTPSRDPRISGQSDDRSKTIA
jgi:hypothetical protein